MVKELSATEIVASGTHYDVLGLKPGAGTAAVQAAIDEPQAAEGGAPLPPARERSTPPSRHEAPAVTTVLTVTLASPSAGQGLEHSWLVSGS